MEVRSGAPHIQDWGEGEGQEKGDLRLKLLTITP